MLALLRGAKGAAASRPVVGWGTRVARPRQAHTMAAAAAPCDNITGFVTDVEGNLEYFQRCVDHSTVLDYADPPARTRLRLRTDCAFVYGGDVCDKGASLAPPRYGWCPQQRLYHRAISAQGTSESGTLADPVGAPHGVLTEGGTTPRLTHDPCSGRGVGCHCTGIGDIRVTQQLVALKRFTPRP